MKPPPAAVALSDRQAERDALKGILSSSLIASFTGGFGGTKVQASGPTAPMTAVTFNLVEYAVRRRPAHMLIVTKSYVARARALIFHRLLGQTSLCIRSVW